MGRKSTRSTRGVSRSPARYRQVQGLVRGLNLLWAFKNFTGATASVAELSQQTKLHRTTVKRLLETLRSAGFVSYVEASNSYRLTFRIRQLSEGFRDETRISEIADPFLRELTEKIKWPSDLATLEHGEIVIRNTTHPHSPLSFSGSVLGYQPGLLRSGVGRAYLAFCPAEERDALLAVIRLRKDEDGKRARDDGYINRMIERIRACGYAVNAAGAEGGSRRFSAIAVPIYSASRVIACINIVFLTRSTTVEQIVRGCLSDLQTTARRIEEAYLRV